MKLLHERRNFEGRSAHRAYYEDLIESCDIEQVALDLIPGRIAERAADRLFCDCPNHASISGTSLHIDTTKQLWHCWGCNEGGDVIQFVEFIQSGRVTRGIKGSQPLSHRQARDYLAATAKMPRLGKSGMSPEEIVNIELKQQKDSRTYQCLTAIAEYYHGQLIEDNDALAWIMGKYAYLVADHIRSEDRTEHRRCGRPHSYGDPIVSGIYISRGLVHWSICEDRRRPNPVLPG